MAGNLNKVTLIGRLGADPEIRSAGGTDVANMRLATSERWKDKRSGEMKERTEWHSVVVWPEGTVNFIADHVEKGDLVYVEGQLQTRKWEDKDGNEKYTTEVVVQGFGGSVQLLAKKGDGNGGSRDDDDRGSRRSSRDDDRGSRRGRDDDDRGSRRSSSGRDRDEDRGSRSSSSRSSASADLDDDIPF